MKFLFLSQGFKVENQPGYDSALRNAKYMGESIEYKNIPYLALGRELGWTKAWNYLQKINEDYAPDVIFFQFFHLNCSQDLVHFLEHLKCSANKPMILASIGDLFQHNMRKLWVRKYPRSIFMLAKYADVLFSKTMGEEAEFLKGIGFKNIVFLPDGFSLAHFKLGDEHTLDEDKKKYDVEMIASPKLNWKLFLKFKTGWGEFVFSLKRYWVAIVLRRRYGDRFGLFGRAWWLLRNEGSIAFRSQCNMFALSKVVVDGEAPYKGVYYSSDRAFFIAGSGIPLVHFYTPRFDKLFVEGENIYFVRKYADLTKVCDKLLSLDKSTLLARRKSTIELVRTRHLIEHRVDTIMSTIEAINLHRSGKCTLEKALRHIRMWHFLPEVDLEEEYHFAVCNWQG